MRTVSGFCSEGCGRCCEFLVMPAVEDWQHEQDTLQVALPKGNPEWRHFLEVHGVEVQPERAFVPLTPGTRPWIAGYNGRTMLFAQSRCQHLTADKRCDLFGKPERPKVCESYPLADDDLRVVPGCTYTID